MRNPFRRRESADPEQRSLDVGSLPSFPAADLASPEAISVDGALRLAPVFAAGRLLASSVSGLPLQVYRRSGDTRQQIAPPSLFVQPSATGTLNDWIFRAMTSLVYRGNAVGLIVGRDKMEYPTEIEWADPADVFVQNDGLMFGRGSFTEPVWHWRGQRIPSEDIVHIPWFTLPNRVWGLSPLAAYARTVSTSLSAQKFSDDWFKAGGVPPGRFRNQNQTVPQDEANRIKTRLLQAMRTHEPLVYGNDWEFEPFTISPSEAKFVETMKLGASQIAAIYGIPPEMIGGETGHSMTYQNVEQQSINFVQFTLMPWLTKLETAFSRLLPRNQYVKFNADAMIRTDAETRYRNYARARIIGESNIDEIRALEDKPPLPNGQGEDYTPLPILAGTSVPPPSATA